MQDGIQGPWFAVSWAENADIAVSWVSTSACLHAALGIGQSLHAGWRARALVCSEHQDGCGACMQGDWLGSGLSCGGACACCRKMARGGMLAGCNQLAWRLDDTLPGVWQKHRAVIPVWTVSSLHLQQAQMPRSECRPGSHPKEASWYSCCLIAESTCMFPST